MLTSAVMVSVIAVSMISVSSGQTDRQFLEAAEYVPATGQIILQFTGEIDLGSTYFNLISIYEGNDTISLSARILESLREDGVTFELGGSDQDILLQMVSPTIRVDEGAISINGISADTQELPLSRVIPIGVVDPHNDFISMATVSAEHFNSMLKQQNNDWRIKILHQTDSPAESLIKLRHAGAVAAIGNQDILGAQSLADFQSIVMICCNDSIEQQLFSIGPSVFSLAPRHSDALEAMLSVMEERGINRIYPVYPDTAAGRVAYDYIKFNARFAVDDGIRYDSGAPGGSITIPLAALIDANLQDSPGARPGVVIVDPDDAPAILLAAATEPALIGDRVSWFGTGISDEPLEGVASIISEVTNYVVPVAGSPHSSLGAILTSAEQGDIAENTLYPVQDTSAYGAYDAVQLIAYALTGSATDPLYPTAPIDAKAHDLVDDMSQLQESLRHNSKLYSGLTGYTGLDIDGGLVSPVHDIMGVRGEQWIRLGVSSHPNPVGLHTIFVDGIILQVPKYEPGERNIHDVVHVGISTHLTQTADLRVAAGVALSLVNQDAIKRNMVVDAMIIEGTQSPAARLGLFSSIGANPIVLHMPGMDDSGYGNAESTIISTSAAHAGTTGDDILRLAPSQTSQAQVLAQIMEQDGIHGVAAVFKQDSPGDYLVQRIAGQFAGEVNTEISYGDDVRYSTLAIPLLGTVLDMVKKYDASNVGILVADDANIEEAIHSTLQFYQVRTIPWYGTLGSAGIPGLVPSVSNLLDGASFTGVAPALVDGGLSGGILDTLKNLDGAESPPHLALVLESVRLAGTVRAEGGSEADMKSRTPSVAASMNGFMIDSLRLDESGNLESSVFDIWTVRDDTWVRDEIYDLTDGYKEKIRIGLAVPLTGPDAQSGITHLYAAHLAVQEHNSMQVDDRYRLTLSVADTGSGTGLAVSDLEEQGASIILGLPDSASLMEARSAAKPDTLLVSCCSDVPSLGIAGDTVLRVAPNQTIQMTPLVESIDKAGIAHLVILHTAQPEEDTLIDALPGHLNITKHRYQDASSLDMINDTITQLSDMHGPDTVGVLVVSYSDTADILEASYQNRDILSVRWFGVSQDGQRPDMTRNLDAMRAAYLSDFEVAEPIALSGAAIKDLQDTIHQATGIMPGRDALATYDSILLIGDALDDLEGSNLGVLLSAVLPNNQMLGVSGPLFMNDDGDLLAGYYSILRTDGEIWYEVSTYLVPVN